MRLVSWNIQWGKGRDGRIDLDRIARIIAGADFVALQEVERNWRDQSYPDQVGRLCALMPGYDYVYGPAVDIGAGVGKPRRQIGNMILSRFPIMSSRNLPLAARPVSGHANDQQAMLEAVIPAASLRLYCAHLNYLSPVQRKRQLRDALAFIADAQAPVMLAHKAEAGPEDDWIAPLGPPADMPSGAMLVGDFNMTPQSAEYEMVTGPRDPRLGRLIEPDRFADALTLAGMAEETGITFPADALRLDHCFVSFELIPAVKHAWIDEAAVGSDHQPVWVEFDLPSA